MTLESPRPLVQVRGEASTGGRTLPGEIGIWLFVLLDLTVFAIMFGIAAYYRATEPEVFDDGRATLLVQLAFINTLVLVTGSLAAARAVAAARDEKWARARTHLGVAAATGIVFTIVKVVEYQHLFADGHTIRSGTFYLCYIGFTLTHLVHVLVGTSVILAVRRILRRRQSVPMVECAALYWHMVDLIWLVLFPLLYLT